MRTAFTILVMLSTALFVLSGGSCQQADNPAAAPTITSTTVAAEPPVVSTPPPAEPAIISPEPAPSTVEPAPSASGAGHLTVNTKVYDFGDVEPRMKVPGEFILTNDGAAPLEVKRPIRKSCGCTEPKLGKYVLQPGESTTMSVAYTAGSTPGPTHKNIWVDVKPPARPKTLTLKITANVKKHIDVSPSRLQFEARHTEKNNTTIVLKSTDGVQFSVKDYRGPANVVELVFDPNYRSAEHLVAARVDISKLRATPRGSITITLDHPKVEKATVTFETIFAFVAHPATRRFGDIEPGRQSVETVAIISNFDEPFDLAEVTAETGLVEVLETAKRPDGWDIKLGLTLPEGNESASVRDHLIVNIKDHPEDTIRVLCYGTDQRVLEKARARSKKSSKLKSLLQKKKADERAKDQAQPADAPDPDLAD